MPLSDGLPSVTLHYAQTVDGRIATLSGQSSWISGDNTLIFAHELRATHDAILIGIGTVLQDDPQLTVRLVEAQNPLRVILDSALRTPFEAKILKEGAAQGTLLAVTKRAGTDRVAAARRLGARVLVLQSGGDGRVDLNDLLHRLGILGVKSLLVEGGSGVITSFLQHGLVDRFIVRIAPKMLGRGTDAVGDLGISNLNDALRLTDMKVEKVGGDLLVEARVTGQSIHNKVSERSVNMARSIWFSGPHKVEVHEEALSGVGREDVMVRAHFSAISHGTEMLVFRGQVSSELSLDLPSMTGSFAFPLKYGYAVVGSVEEKGESVKDLEVGDKVFVLHPHQTRFVVPADSVVKLPNNITPEAGVFTANLESALNVLLDAPIHIAETVVIFGQGVIGLLLTQLARRAGAGKVVVVDSFQRRRDMALQMGADIAFAPGQVNAELVRTMTDGRGADVVYEASGSPEALQYAIDVAAPQSMIVVVSWYGTRPVTLNLGDSFHRDRLKIVSSQFGRIDPGLAPRWDRSRRTQVVKELLKSLQLTKMITHHFPLRSAAEAYRLIDENPDETVQVVFNYD